MAKQKIKDYITQIRGVSYKPVDIVDAENGTPILRANNIQDDGMLYDDLVFITPQRIKDNQILKKGDIVICTSSGSKNLVGKATTFNGFETNISFGAFCKGIRITNNLVNPDFIRLFFKSKIYREQISASSTGANINNIKSEHIDNLLINIPSAEIQNIAVRELTVLIKAISVKKQQLLELNDLVKSRFIEMFGDPIANPLGWDKVPLSTIAEIKIGPFGSLLHKEDYIEHGHPLVNPSHIIDSKIVIDSKLTISDDKYAELSSYQLKIGDVVLGRRGEMGRCAVVPKEGLLCGTGSLIIRANADVTAEFIQNIISFPTFKEHIESMAIGQTMLNLNVPIVSNFQIIKPPLEVQKRYYDFVKLTDKSKFVCRLNPSIFCAKFLRFRHPP